MTKQRNITANLGLYVFGGAAISLGLIKRLQVGNAEVKSQVFAAFPIAKTIGMALGMEMDGMGGYEILSRFVTTFDYGDKEIVFHMPGWDRLQRAKIAILHG